MRLCAHCLCYSEQGSYEEAEQVFVCDECYPAWAEEEARARAAWATITASVGEQDQSDDW